MRVSVGRVADISDAECVAVGDGRAIVVRVHGEIRAYRNRCANGGAPLGGTPVHNGVLTCPVHQWKYRVDDGVQLGSSRKLERLPVEVTNGEAFVLLPNADAPGRPARLLATDRDDTWPNGFTLSDD